MLPDGSQEQFSVLFDLQVLRVESGGEDTDETVLKYFMGYLHTGQVDSKGLCKA